MLNQVILDGSIVSDISLRQSKKGVSVADFRFKNKEPKAKNAVFIDIEVWGRQAEIVAEKAGRNSRLVVHGELRMDNWQTKDTVEKRSKLKITAHRVIFINILNSKLDNIESEQKIDNF